MLHHAAISWNVLALWLFFLRLQISDLDVCGVQDLEPDEHFQIDFKRKQIRFDIRGTDEHQRLCLRSGLLEYSMQLAAEHGFDYRPPWAPTRRHLQLLTPPTAPIPTQRQTLLDARVDEVS